MNTQIQMSINEKGFLNNLGSIFTSSTKVLNELCQNAARANATRISIELAIEDNQPCLYVSDNGCGIRDWQKLLTIADTGWTGDTLKANPYGMGFLSAIFGCDTIEVISKGKKFKSTCQDIINRKPVSIEHSDSYDGTIIVMHGIKPELRNHVESRRLTDIGDRYISSLGRGYDIEVHLSVNGKTTQLTQHHSISYLEQQSHLIKHEFEHGVIYFNPNKLDTRYTTYLQGAIILDKFGDYHIVHLNENTPARMPDRENLIEEEMISDIIQVELNKLIESVLTEKAVNVESLDLHGKLNLIHKATKYCPHILNSVNYLDWNIAIKSEEFGLSRQESNYSVESKLCSRNELEGARVIYEIPDNYDEESNETLVYLGMQPDVFFVNTSLLDDGHWVHNLDIQEVENLDIQSSFENLSSVVEFSGRYVLDVAVCNKYELTGPLGSVQVNDTVLVTEQDESWKSLLVIPANLTANDALAMYASYEDDYGELLEVEFDVDTIALDTVLTRIRATSTSTLLEQAIQTTFKSPSMKALLDAGSYTVSIDSDGHVTVSNQ